MHQTNMLWKEVGSQLGMFSVLVMEPLSKSGGAVSYWCVKILQQSSEDGVVERRMFFGRIQTGNATNSV